MLLGRRVVYRPKPLDNLGAKRVVKDRFFIHLYEEGFAKIPNEKAYGNKSDTMMGPNNVQMITGYIEEQMRMLNSLNVPSFKSVLSD